MRYVDHARFGNLSTDELLVFETEMRTQLALMQETIKARLIAESGISVGLIYRVADDDRPLAGRRILVEGVGAGMGWQGIGAGKMGQGFRCYAYGRMDCKANDGWTLRRQNITANRLTLEDAA